MKPVIGLGLIFIGVLLAYMVVTGKLPSGQPQGSQGNPSSSVNPSTRGSNIGIGTNISGTGSGPEALLSFDELGEFPAYVGMI